jgi:cell division protein FtsL
MPVAPGEKQKRKSQWIIAAIALFCALVAVSFVKEFVRSYQVKQEIQDLKNSIAQVDAQNKQAGDFVEYLKTDSYFDAQVRLKLGLRSPGEKVLVVNNPPLVAGNKPRTFDIPAGTRALQTFQRDERGNPEKWLGYFFGQ